MTDATLSRKELLFSERGAISKPAGKIKAAICYPNFYKVGMSSLGFQTIYKELNSIESVSCERVFLMGDEIPRSIESGRRLEEFDIVAFSISFELDCINFAKILNNAKIPLKREDRDGRHPLIAVGGVITVFNFTPLSDFVDIFILGEADELSHKVFGAIADCINSENKETLLKRLSEFESIYIPDFPKERSPARIKDLDKFDTSTCILTPYTEFSDMYLIEISRGCARKCSFCVSAYGCGSYRHRSSKAIMESAKRGLKLTEKIGLVGTAVSDYPYIDELCGMLLKENAKVSFSSLRADRITKTIIDTLVNSGQRSLTIAPEAGSERLRDFIKKGISDKDIYDAVSLAADNGIKGARLYFMVGLPTEEKEDIEAIVTLVKGLSKILPVKAKLMPFVPKPKTPFEHYDIEPTAILKDKIKYITNRLRPLERVKVKSESVRLSCIEAYLAKGGQDALYSYI